MKIDPGKAQAAADIRREREEHDTEYRIHALLSELQILLDIIMN